MHSGCHTAKPNTPRLLGSQTAGTQIASDDDNDNDDDDNDVSDDDDDGDDDDDDGDATSHARSAP